MSDPVVLNKQLVTAVIELIEFYSKKGAFKVNEYKDIASIDERLKEALSAMEKGTTHQDFTSQEYGFILLIFKEGSQRIPTSIESFGQLFSIYQSYQSLMEQKLAEEKEKATPSVEELN